MNNDTATKTVLVLSYNNVGNFGDRLGYHLINGVLPPDCAVVHGNFRPWNVPDLDYDLVVVGIGNSLFEPLLTDNLFRLLDKAKSAIGIFGTQYRHAINPEKMARVIDYLDIWYARYREDIETYGRNKPNVQHLGDWLIDACPMAIPTNTEVHQIGREIWKDLPLDRTIQTIQKYKRVISSRLHPLLCALTSAEQVAYTEQPDRSGMPSGKFTSMFLDVFQTTFPESVFFEVDTPAVIDYKLMVRNNIRQMEQQIDQLLSQN
ncbi:MAG: hypothetical protein ACFCD0_06415 [Gemmataceae bacterium]